MGKVNQRSESIQQLKELLRALFQFNAAELDFGIYRIMNYKRKEIENFIESDLIKAVEEEFEKYKTATQKESLSQVWANRHWNLMVKLKRSFAIRQ